MYRGVLQVCRSYLLFITSTVGAYIMGRLLYQFLTGWLTRTRKQRLPTGSDTWCRMLFLVFLRFIRWLRQLGASSESSLSQFKLVRSKVMGLHVNGFTESLVSQSATRIDAYWILLLSAALAHFCLSTILQETVLNSYLTLR